MELVVTRVPGCWEMGTELDAMCWKVCKARLPVQADGLQFACFQPGMTTADCMANHLHEKGKLLKPWEIAPEWESHGLLNPLLQDALGQAVPKGYPEGGESFALKKEHDVFKCRNKMAATKWSNFSMMLLLPRLYRCGTFFTPGSAVKCTC